MKIIIPNAKEVNTNLENASFYLLSDRSKPVLDAISQFDVKKMAAFYKLNEAKAELEADRWYRIRTGQAKTYPAWQLYDGLMYRYMDRRGIDSKEENYLRDHVRVATALYGLIHPFAAIAPQAAAVEYGLEVIAQDIQEISENFTRFWILGDKAPSIALEQVAKKVSLALTLPDNLPGALYKAMSVFSWRGISLTKIESRPLKTALGEYFFILDLDNQSEELLTYSQKELTSLDITYKVLGNYLVYMTS